MKKIFESKKSRIVAIALLVLFLWKLDVPNFIKSIHPQKGDFIKAGKMSVPRYGHEAILLDDGNVLIYLGAETDATPEIYNPKTKRFTRVGKMIRNGGFFSPVKLNNGKILISGGNGGSGLKSTQMYNPKTKTFEKGPDMNYSRKKHTATLLKDGRILIAGGGFRLAKESEIYDPKTNKFKIAAKMNIPRYEHSAALLNDGRVLIIGGFGYKNKKSYKLSSAEIYDPQTNKFELAGNLNIARKKPNLYLLKNSDVLITSGTGDYKGQGIWLREIEIYNPETNEFKIVAKRTSESDMPAEVLLKDDKILFTGGCTGVGLSLIYYKYTETFDPQSNQFTTGKDMNRLRTGHEMTLLKDGNVLVSGSEGTGRTAELYIN